ncbi:hypothetical protein D9758_017000 [Tetrapyrgos nigripes]|uniref:Uncharacterized protein n=1 Tax=Tetrapyrgos nigripes TaxID=182062 RepID=A0A8H5FDW7_9AGAR|nr:hypothetical protein D9758_017000 [Tetrapyrgos nigripes]
MSDQSGWVYIDDTDDRLHYSGQWQLTNGSTTQKGDSETLNDPANTWQGRIWNDTVHKTANNGSTVTFGFNGTSYAVFGSFVFPGTSPKGTVDCFLDGSSSVDDFTSWGPNASSPDAILTVKVTNLIESNFYLDYILIRETIPNPTPDVSSTPGSGGLAFRIPSPWETLFDELDASEGQIEFSSGWLLNTTFSNVFPCTRTPGSSMTYTFNGTSLQLYGDLGVITSTSNMAMYQLDDQPPQSIPLLPPDDGPFWYQQFFNLSGLSPTEEHKVVITHNGTATGMALALEWFSVERSSPQGLASSATPSSSPTPTPTSSVLGTTGNHHLKGGVIGGIVVGVVALIFVVGICSRVWMQRRRKNQNDIKAKLNMNPTPFVEVAGLDFDPYNSDNRDSHSPAQITRSNPHKRRSNPHIRHSSGSSGNQDADADMVNQLRWGNLKLQQRIAVLVGRNQSEPPPGLPNMSSGATEPVIHSDSGWRMREQALNNLDEMREVPPNYTES